MDWPIKINVRRTTVIDDNNKEILTTAMGRGYESQEYVLGSAVSAKKADLDLAISERDSTIARLREAAEAVIDDADLWRSSKHPTFERVSIDTIERLAKALQDSSDGGG